MNKIYIFCPVMKYGGVEFLTLKLAMGFKEKGLDVSVLTLDSDGAFISKFIDNKIDVIFSPSKNILSKLIFLKKRKESGVLIFMPSNYSYLSSIFFLKDKKFIVVDNLNDFVFDSRFLHNFIAFVRLFQLNFLFDGVVYSYKKAEKKISNNIHTRIRQKVIYHPVSPSFKVNIELGEGSDFVYVGRLESEKGVMILLEAFLYLREEYNLTPSLKILGSGSLFFEVNEYIRLHNLDNIKMKGFVKDPQNYIVKSKYLILPSMQEGCSGVVKESIYLGIPAIVANVASGGPQEMIGYGKYGEIFDCGSFKSLAKSISKIVFNNYRISHYDHSYCDLMRKKLDLDYAILEYMDFLDE